MFDSSLSWFLYQEDQTDCSQSDIGLETDQPIGDNGKEILSFEQILFYVIAYCVLFLTLKAAIKVVNLPMVMVCKFCPFGRFYDR